MSATKLRPLWIDGYFPVAIESQGANFTAKDGRMYIVADDVDVQLPAPVVNTKIGIKSLGSNTINLLRDGTELIEGEADDFTFSSTNQSVMLISDGTDWFII
jgi:lipopolysaccharide export system protein LptA